MATTTAEAVAELHTAFEAMRRRAYVACAGRWRNDDGQITGNGTRIATVAVAAGHNSGDHIAGWSAEVGLEVAEWLERTAWRLREANCDAEEWSDDVNHALAIAHAYNRNN